MADGVGIVGYGRFGRALGVVLAEAGVPFSAFDPRAQIEDSIRATTLEALAASRAMLIIAVPVPHVRDALNELRPHLTTAHTVLDVGSVKTGPVQAMTEVLGSDIPWVGTHPLFGPTSLALGERPLHVVVCPNPLHPDATTRVRAFWESIDCHVIEQDPTAHDHAMAITHALTFFVAKGMLDIGAGEGVPFAPPSFRAIERTIDMVRSDAGHLFGAIHRENPFASDARRKLIDALAAVDAQISAAPTPTRPDEADEAIAIPELSGTPALRETRELIDELDQELLSLLARRANLSRRARRAKAGMGRGVLDSAREAQVIEARERWGREVGIDETSIGEIFDSILRFSRRVQGGQ